MRRLLKWAGILALALLPRLAEAAACASVAACSTTPCDWNTAATWDCGHVPTTASSDTVTVNGSVVLRSNSLTAGTTTINGEWIFDENATWNPARDANGYAVYTVVGDIVINNGGALRLRGGHKLAFDATAAARVLQVQPGGILDIEGQVVETTIANFSDADADTDCAAAGTVGRKFTITPTAGISTAHKTGRVVFQSGMARNRQYEIRLTTATTLSVCTDTADATSGSDTTGGQRLTPHANRNAFCTGASGCCTGANAGTCPTVPLNRHTEPAPYDNAECTAAKVPYLCCTGAGTGVCTASTPAIGDKIAIVYDAWIYRSAGTNSFSIEDVGASNPMPKFVAVNIANAGSTTANAISFTAATGTTTVPDIRFLNFHDFAPLSDAWLYKGTRNFKIEWSAIHDVTPDTQGDTNAAMGLAESGTARPDGVTISDSIFYRTQGVAVHYNEGGEFPATGCRFLRNLLVEGCLSGAAECGGAQMDYCNGGESAYNVGAGFWSGANTYAAWPLNISGFGASMHHNWIVNTGQGPQTISSTDGGVAVNQSPGITHNYVSNIGSHGTNGGSTYSNIIRNVGLAQADDFAVGGMVNPINALGNYVLGADSTTAASADCTGGNYCGHLGIRYVYSAYTNSNKKASRALDNIVLALPPYAGDTNRGRCVEWDGVNFSGGGTNADWATTVSYLTCDGRGQTVTAVRFDQDALSTPTAFTVSNVLTTDGNNSPAVRCASGANINETISDVYSLNSSVTVESGGDYHSSGDCTSAPAITRIASRGFKNRLASDYDLLAGASALTNSIGSRAFRFNQSALTSIWPVLTFDGEQPADVTNGVSNADSDSDGVMDLHDNCDYTFNPSQYDSDGDGKGNSCDASP